MPRRHPLPLPPRPGALLRLQERRLAGASTRELEAELLAHPQLASRVAWLAGLAALGRREVHSPGELCELALAAVLLEELETSRAGPDLGLRRRAQGAVLVGRLAARLAPRLPRPLGLSVGELFCLPLVRACAEARVETGLADGAARAREAARLAGAWGLSGPAVEALSLWGPQFRPGAEQPITTVLELAGRLAEGAAGAGRRGDLEGSAGLAAARTLGLRTAELDELAGFAVSVLAEQAA